MYNVAILWMILITMAGCVTGSSNPDSKTRGSTLNMEFVAIPGGQFVMGCGEWQIECAQDEIPAHTVTLDGFEIGKYEVTQKQWVEIMGRNPAEYVLCGENCPVEQVSWHDVQAFIKQLNGSGNRKYRLPTEAEWEYACRSGGKEERYCGDNQVNNVAWYDIQTLSPTSPVGKKKPNAFGLYDMSGNVWEWVEDWHCKQMYLFPEKEQKNPLCKDSASGFHVLRGGSWFNSSTDVRSTVRNRNLPHYKNVNLGFRLVRIP